MRKIFDIAAFIGACALAVVIHFEPTPLELGLASALMVVGGLVILQRDIERW